MKMQRVWTMQVLLLVLGLLSLMTPLTSAQYSRYQDVVNEFINEYNLKSGSENLYRLSILNLQLEENNDPAIPQPLSFTIRETVCPNTENLNPDECDFKENGLVKECIGAISLDSTKPSVDLSCDGPEKFKRGGFFRKIKKGLKKIGNSLKKRLKNPQIGFSIPIPG